MIKNKKRAVAYFDILGFKAKIANIDLDNLLKDYERVINHTDGYFYVKNGKVECTKMCHRYIFSDSIILIAYDDTEKSFIDMFSYAWRMMQSFIIHGFPLRGAFTYGEVCINIEKNIFLGKAIVDAVTMEGKQDWIGAIIDDYLMERYKNCFLMTSIEKAIMKLLAQIYDVPFKDGTHPKKYALNWRLNLVVEDGIKSLFKNEPYDEDVQKKIDNTLKFSKEIRNRNFYYLTGNNIPPQYAHYYVGYNLPQGNKVPFNNGDDY